MWQNESKLRFLCPPVAVCLLALLAIGCEGVIGGNVDTLTGADASPPDGSEGSDGAADPPPDAALIIDPDAPLPCDMGDLNAVGGDGTCYWVTYSTTTDRTGSQTACEDEGGTLAVLKDSGQNAIAIGLTVQAMAASEDTVVDYWISATDSAEEGIFLWGDGTALIFDNWRDGEPNNGGVNGEDCGIIEADRAGTWDDRPCDNDADAGITVNYGRVCQL